MNFSLKNIILIVVLALMFVGSVVQMYVMYRIANAKAFNYTGTTINANGVGVDAQAFWTSNKPAFFYPTVGNLIGMALLGVIMFMG